MKHVFFALILLLSLRPGPTQAQSEAPVEKSERVITENLSRQVLHARAVEWAKQHFSFGPASGLQSDPAAGSVRIPGQMVLKLVAGNGKEFERKAQFEFVFQATDQGYSYSVGAFRVAADPENPNALVSFDDYLTQLRAERSVERTKNDRRITAQAVSRASEVALSFRSYMNSRPETEDGEVGL
ncbi:hypothetical protein [Hymenobacter sp. B81]|uniref:hypothetical protein n=1 Tax=Hymenobacter sp. B81 TaxID=3344878 RepID=UPI0037DCEA02